MGLVLTPGPQTREIRLETRKGTEITNQQSFEITAWHRHEHKVHEDRYGTEKFRTGPSPLLNQANDLPPARSQAIPSAAS